MQKKNLSVFVWTSVVALFLGLIFARVLVPEQLWVTIVLSVALVGALGFLIKENARALRGRTAAYGLNSAITVLLVLGILGVVNFMANRYPQKLDMTQDKVHTLSDQTEKTMKGLKVPVKAVVFVAPQLKEQSRPLMDNLKALNPKFEVEYVDPNREPTRAIQAGIRGKATTVQLIAGEPGKTRESKVEDPNEEKMTNALIKLLKSNVPIFCAITGHGEKAMSGSDADGYEAARKGLMDQSYEVKEINLIQEAKIPETCTAIGILGAKRAFFPQEIKLLSDYLVNGGRAVIATDINLKGADFAPELTSVLEQWYIKPEPALIVDPSSRMLGADASVALVATYAKGSPITKDFREASLMPLSRPLSILPGAPSDYHVDWLAQTTPNAVAISDMKAIASGQVNVSSGKKGPFNIAVTVVGNAKGSTAGKKPTRLVVFGNSNFANNNYARFGGNLDLFLNSVSWVMEDESVIGIRAKEQAAGKVELSAKSGQAIGILTVFVIPLLIAIAGIAIWVWRRRL